MQKRENANKTARTWDGKSGTCWDEAVGLGSDEQQRCCFVTKESGFGATWRPHQQEPEHHNAALAAFTHRSARWRRRRRRLRLSRLHSELARSRKSQVSQGPAVGGSLRHRLINRSSRPFWPGPHTPLHCVTQQPQRTSPSHSSSDNNFDVGRPELPPILFPINHLSLQSSRLRIQPHSWFRLLPPSVANVGCGIISTWVTYVVCSETDKVGVLRPPTGYLLIADSCQRL